MTLMFEACRTHEATEKDGARLTLELPVRLWHPGETRPRTDATNRPFWVCIRCGSLYAASPLEMSLEYESTQIPGANKKE